MPTVPGMAEALGKALVVEAPTVVSAPRIVEAARRAAQSAQEGNYRAGLEGIRSPNINSKKAQEKTEQIGIRNRATEQRERPAGTLEEDRYDRAEKWRALTEEFAQKGYDSMAINQQDALCQVVLEEALRIPVIADQLRQINPYNPVSFKDRDLRAYAERLLRDPNMAKNIREGHLAVSENQSLLIGNGEDLAADELKIAENAEQFAKEALEEATRRKTLVDAQMKMFDRDPATGLPVLGADSAKRIDDLQKNRNSIDADYESGTREAAALIKRIETLSQEHLIAAASTSVAKGGGVVAASTPSRPISEITREIQDRQDELNKAQNKAAEAKAKIDELQRLEDREKKFTEDQARLKADEAAKNLAYKTAQIETAKRKRELGDAIKLRQSQEEDIARAFEGIVPGAVTNLLGEQISSVAAKVDEEMKAMGEEAKNADQKALFTIMNAQWNTEVNGIRKLWKGRREINSSAVMDDYNLLLQGGPEAVIRKLLANRYSGLGGAVALQALLKDGTFVEMAGKDVVKNLLAKKFLSTGIDSVDVDVISRSQWGDGMITAALAHRENITGELAELQKAGVLGRGGVMQEIRRNPWWLLLLLGVSGIAGLVAGPGGAVIGSAAATEYVRRHPSNPILDLAA